MTVPVLAALIGLGAAITAVVGFMCAILALRAKSRVRRIIYKRAGADRELAELMRLATTHNLKETDIERAKNAVKEAASELSRKDRDVIEEGLEQPSKSGEKRFIEDLLSAA